MWRPQRDLNPAEINKIQGFFRPKVAQSGPVWYKLDTGVQFDFRAVSLALSSFNLRLESIDVARVEGGFAHVREPHYWASQPFQSDRETAMRWHSEVVALSFLARAGARSAVATRLEHGFWVSADQPLHYPSDQFLALPDEHQTFLPVPKRDWELTLKPEAPGYYLVVAMLNKVNGTTNGWTFLLQTEDLLSFSLVPGAGDPAHGNAFFWRRLTLQRRDKPAGTI